MIWNSLAMSLIILFVHACTWDGMIFEDIKKIVKPEGKLYKPIYGCPICMTPWWGTIIYLLFFRVGWVDWILTIGAAAGFSVVWVVLLSVRDFCIEYVNKFIENE